MRYLAKDVRGDTIVEVLISILVIALVLSGAYATSNASTRNITDAQERIQALGIAQLQVEDLRAQAASIFCGGANPCVHAHTSYLTGGSPFCFVNNAFTTGAGNCNGMDSSSAVQNYTAIITGSSGQTYSPSVPSGTNPPISTYGFKVTVTWNSVASGVTTGNITTYYRVDI
jgi:Tfp pilus assembly protein PilV